MHYLIRRCTISSQPINRYNRNVSELITEFTEGDIT